MTCSDRSRGRKERSNALHSPLRMSKQILPSLSGKAMGAVPLRTVRAMLQCRRIELAERESILTNVWVVDLGQEAHFRRCHRVLLWQKQLKLELSACVMTEWALTVRQQMSDHSLDLLTACACDFSN